MSKISPQSIIVTNKNDGTLLAVQVLENENAEESIIMLHGGPGYPDSFVEVSEVLNDKFRVISFHQRGTGLSKNPSKDYSIDSYISDIEAISEYFQLSSFHIYGHSWGGLYGQLYAEKHSSKVLSLFLSSPSSGTGELWTEMENCVLQYLQNKASDWEFMQMGLFSLVGAVFGLDWAHRKLFHLVLTVYHRGHTGEIHIDEEVNVKAEPIIETRKHLQKHKELPLVIEDTPYPVALTYGESDIYGSTMEKSIARYPSAKMHIIESAGHIPYIHNPSQYFKVVKEFYQL